MDREKAWKHYFQTGDKEPLVRAYWDSISYLAWAKYPNQKEDMFQVGMLGLLKAIERIDPKRVKSKDAWVWLNVKGMMYNIIQPKPTVPLVLEIEPGREDDKDFDLIIKDLPARKRLILSLIYKHDWRRTEIGKLLGISSMRVGQIEQEALVGIA